MSMVETTCLECHESLMIDPAWMGRLVECPHCGKPTPATPPPPTPAPPPIVKTATSAETKPAPEPSSQPLSPTGATIKEEQKSARTVPANRAVRPLPPWKQRASERRRRTQLVAIIGGIILLGAAVLLISLG